VAALPHAETAVLGGYEVDSTLNFVPVPGHYGTIGRCPDGNDQPIPLTVSCAKLPPKFQALEKT